MNIIEFDKIVPKMISLSRISDENSVSEGVSYGRRVVESYEIDYMTWGEGVIITEGVSVEAKRARLFFRQPGMVVEGIGSYHCYFMKLMLFDSRRFIVSEEDQLKRIDIPTYIDIEEPILMQQLFNDLYTDYVRGADVTGFVIKARLMAILLKLYETIISRVQFSQVDGMVGHHSRGIQSVVKMIQSNPTDNYCIEQLAEEAGYSAHYFCRLFRQEIGETPIAYTNRCRINHIKLELIETRKGIKEIMIESGFENEGYFYRLFRKLTGTTPADYRKRHRGMYS